MNRKKDDAGRSSYAGSGMSLASFRESSELEFGCDDAFILHPEADNAEGDTMRLRHLKSRHGEAKDLLFRFDRPRMPFAEPSPFEQPDLSHTGGKRARGRNGKLLSELAEMWNRPAAAGDDLDDGGTR